MDELGFPTSRALARAFLLSTASVLVGACQKPMAETPPDAPECPAGQTFDGQFCRLDGELAAREPLPASDGTGPGAGGSQADVAGGAAWAETGAGGIAAGDGGIAAGDGGIAAGEERSGSGDHPGDPEGDSEQAPPNAEQATPVDVSMAAQAGPLITYLAGSHLPAGAKPLGAPFAAQFAEGQIFEQKVQLTVGKCYTVVAAGIHPVRNVDIAFFADGVDEPLVEDDAVGPQAVLGSRSRCFVPQRGDLRLVVTVEKGQGVVAGQVFEK